MGKKDIFGLPEELGISDNLAMENQAIMVKTVKKKFGKVYTVVEGFGADIDLKDLTKKLKNKFACGGTNHLNMIELQGDHKKKMMEALIGIGFAPETIQIK